MQIFLPSQVDLSTNLTGSSIDKPEIKSFVVKIVEFLQKNGDRWHFKKGDFINSMYLQDRSNDAYTFYPIDILNVLVWMKLLTENNSVYEPTFKLLAILEEFKKIS